MNGLIEIHWTSGSIDDARKVARYLIGKKWVAQAEIIPWIESLYLRDEQVRTEQQSKIIFKTTHEFINEIKQVIVQNCKYEVPEITCLQVENVNQEYSKWIQNSIKHNTEDS
jgi:periplasmic divalent cation tolerance protein